MQRIPAVFILVALLSACTQSPNAAQPAASTSLSDTGAVAASATGSATPSSTPVTPPPSTTPGRSAVASAHSLPAPTPDRSFHVRLLGAPPGTGYALEAIDARGLVIEACYDIVVSQVATASHIPTPPPQPTVTTSTHLTSCQSFLEFQINEPWGGTYTIVGSVRANGRVVPISMSGTIAPRVQ